MTTAKNNFFYWVMKRKLLFYGGDFQLVAGLPTSLHIYGIKSQGQNV